MAIHRKITCLLGIHVAILLLLSSTALSREGPVSVPEAPWPEPPNPLQDVPRATQDATWSPSPVPPASIPYLGVGAVDQKHTDPHLPASARGLAPQGGHLATSGPLSPTPSAVQEAVSSSESWSYGTPIGDDPTVLHGDSGTVLISSRDGPPAFGSEAARSLMTTSAPGPALPPVPGARAVIPRPEGSPRLPSLQTATTPGLAGNASEAKPSICANNPLTFFPSDSAFQTTCRVYLYAVPDRTSFIVCTGWFVGLTFVATAGHCVAKAGSGIYTPASVNGRFGTVCCRPQPTTGPDSCPDGYGLDIVGLVTTDGWLNLGTRSNDGAVLLVRRPANLAAGIGIPVNYGPKNPRCTTETVTYQGFPRKGTTSEGCNQDFREQRAKGQATGLTQCTTDVNYPTYAWDGPACAGMSGGPLFAPASLYFGILTEGDTTCTAGGAWVYFTAVVNAGSDWGVCISCMIYQLGGLPPPTPALPPSPPPQPLATSPPPPPPATCFPPQYIPNGTVPNARFLSGVGELRHRQTFSTSAVHPKWFVLVFWTTRVASIHPKGFHPSTVTCSIMHGQILVSS